MFDTGADDVLIPKRHIPPHLLENLQVSNYTIFGVNSEPNVHGEFRTTLDFGGITFAEIRILVTDYPNCHP